LNLYRIYRTVRHLKPIQIGYQLFYRIFPGPGYTKNHTVVKHISPEKTRLDFWLTYQKIQFAGDTVFFAFINKTQPFPTNNIDWNYSNLGKLWTYHLNYFDFLAECDFEDGIFLLQNYIQAGSNLKVGLEPYPTSLRIVNWIKYCLKHQYFSENVIGFIKSDVDRLEKRIEHHLLANHILENACALWISSIFFCDTKLNKKAGNLLEKQIIEQFSSDGLHFEKSMMYHSILISKLLDCYQISSEQNKRNEKIETLLTKIISKGVSKIKWFLSNQNFPAFNDFVPQEVPHINQLITATEHAGISMKEYQDNTSGYFKLEKNELLVFADYGSIGPDYQPGHSHADTFSFVLFINGEPVIVDPGISTYEKGRIRDYERSTKAHNTILYSNENSSEVWNAFRVGRRAKVFNLITTENSVSAWHNGYRHLGVRHHRRLQVLENGIEICDLLEGKTNKEIISSIHFHPDTELVINENSILINNKLMLKWSGIRKWDISDYFFADGFNMRRKAKEWSANVEPLSHLYFQTV
jgi:hypothetical protein